MGLQHFAKHLERLVVVLGAICQALRKECLTALQAGEAFDAPYRTILAGFLGKVLKDLLSHVFIAEIFHESLGQTYS